MEAIVLVDEQGHIISAVVGVRAPGEVEDAPPSPNMGPIAEDGQQVVELGLSDEFARQPLSAVIDQLTSEVNRRLQAGT